MPARDRGGIETTLTREQVLAARNGSTPTPVIDTLSTAVDKPTDQPAQRVCDACETPLSPRQKRACSMECARQLGSSARHQGKVSQRPAASSAAASHGKQPDLGFLDSLPAVVVSVVIEHGSWNLTAVRHV